MAVQMRGHIRLSLSTMLHLCSNSTHPLRGSIPGLRIKLTFQILQVFLTTVFLVPQLEMRNGNCECDAYDRDVADTQPDHLRTIYRLIEYTSSHQDPFRLRGNSSISSERRVGFPPPECKLEQLRGSGRQLHFKVARPSAG